MDLVATPKNPIPLGASTGFIEIRKGLRIRFASWQSVLKERRGTVCILPGRTEFIEKYFEVVGELRRRGFAVAVLDWRGQGGSSRLLRNPLKGHINDFSEYEEDLAHFMKAVVLPDCPTPYFALAHSMAAMVLFKAATKRGCWFTRMVLTAPMVRILGLPFPHQVCRQIADAMTLFGVGKRPVPGDARKYLPIQNFEGNPLTSDRERYLRNLIYAGPAYQALVLCWRSGQRSPIHDHTGSSCGVKVISGVATETTFAVAPNDMVYALSSRHLPAGSTCASQDADVHQMSNLQPAGADLITLHIYSPALVYMNMYSIVAASVERFFDPINNEFVSGAGI